MKYSAVGFWIAGSLCALAQTDIKAAKEPGATLVGATVSRVCKPTQTDYHPAPETEFLTTDESACFLLLWRGGHKDDRIRMEWVNPLGTVIQKNDNQVKVGDCTNCFWWVHMDIRGKAPAFAPGDWQVRVFWNDLGLAAVPFRIVSPMPGPLELISNTTLPAATVGAPYFYRFTLRGGEAPYRWTASSALPPGLSLSSDGVVSGTPSRRGGYSFGVTALDRAGNTLARKIGFGVAPAPTVHLTASAVTGSRPPPGCAAGPNVLEFPKDQAEIWLEFKIEGGKANDGVWADWLDPAGDVAFHNFYRQKSDAAECMRFLFPIARQEEVPQGDWRVRVLWNDGEVFSMPFRVGSSQVTSNRVLPGRWALLIGNSSYRHLPAIPSATGDVDLLAGVLRQDGFEVLSRSNLGVKEWRQAEREFLGKVEKDGVAVVYFSGYGLHEGSENWLAPVDFDPNDARSLSTKAYSVVRLRQLLEEKQVKLKIFFLNAGRAAAGLESKTQRAGLARPDVDEQTVLCLAAPPDRTEAVRAEEKTSPFARGLAEVLKRPNVGLRQLLESELPKAVGAMGTDSVRPAVFLQNPEDFRFALQAEAGPRGALTVPGYGPGIPVYKIGSGVSKPVPIYKPEPLYTEAARKAKFQGTVVLAAVIDPQGNAKDVRVVRPLGMGLDQNAIEAVQTWRFRPGMKDGKPVAVESQIEVNFQLLNDPKLMKGGWSIGDVKFDVPPGTSQPILIKTGSEGFPQLDSAISLRVSFNVNPQGTPENITAQAPAPFAAPPVESQVRQWKFFPAIRDGKAVSAPVLLLLSYKPVPAGQQ